MKGNLGNLTRIEDLDKRLVTKNDEEIGKWKQNNPLEAERRDEDDEQGLIKDFAAEGSLQVPETELYKGKW